MTTTTQPKTEARELLRKQLSNIYDRNKPHRDEGHNKKHVACYKDVLGTFVGRLLLYFMHLALRIFIACVQLAQNVRHRLLFMPINSASSVEQIQSLINASEHHKKAMPKHICLAIMEDTLNFEIISRMAVWCHALGAKYISFYDPLGRLVSSSNVLEQELEKKLFECRIPKDHIQFLHPGEKARPQVSGDVTTARVLDITDGHAKVSDVIASILNNAIASKENSSANITDLKVEDIQAQLAVAGENFPDPECVLCFSAIESTVGLLPWQLDHSELIRVNTHHGILPSQFLEALERYCRIEKRFGK